MNARVVGYWVCTALVAFAFGSGGLAYLAGAEAPTQGMLKLGYPLYFVWILGIWKVLGAVAILAPKLPRLKEWAYAGIVFDLTGAAWTHWFGGDPFGKVIPPLVILGLCGASWALRPNDRRLPGPPV